MTNESRWEPGGARRKSIAALQEQQAAIDAVASSAHPVAAAIASAAVAATACAEGGATATADSQWLRQLDPATGRYYFTHHETGESRWEEAEEAQVPEWERLVDSASGHHYVVNRRTSESKWVVLKSNSVAQVDDAVGGGEATTLERVEAAEQGGPEAAEQGGAEAQADVAAQAADEWVRALDPASGHFYRINRRTSESRWDLPGEYDAATPSRGPAAEAAPASEAVESPEAAAAAVAADKALGSGAPTDVLAASNSVREVEQLEAKVLAATEEAKADEQQQQQQQQQQQEEEEEEEEEVVVEGHVLTNSIPGRNGAALDDFIALLTPDMGGVVSPPPSMPSPGTPRASEPGFEFEAYIGGLGSGSTPRASPKQAGAGNGDSGAAWDTPPPPPPPPPLPPPPPAEEAEQLMMKQQAARNRRASRSYAYDEQ